MSGLLRLSLTVAISKPRWSGNVNCHHYDVTRIVSFTYNLCVNVQLTEKRKYRIYLQPLCILSALFKDVKPRNHCPSLSTHIKTEPRRTWFSSGRTARDCLSMKSCFMINHSHAHTDTLLPCCSHCCSSIISESESPSHANVAITHSACHPQWLVLGFVQCCSDQVHTVWTVEESWFSLHIIPCEGCCQLSL